MRKDKNSVCCNQDCNQGRDCPVRLGTYKPAEAVHQIAEPVVSAKNMQPGDELHLSLLMAPHGLNMVVGQDRVHLLAYARDVWNAAQQAAAQQAVQAAELGVERATQKFIAGIAMIAVSAISLAWLLVYQLSK